MPSCLLTGVHHLNSWSFKGDNHHKDSVFSFLLTSSRIDSIRASQNLDRLILYSAYFSKNLNIIAKSAAMLTYS